MDYLPLLDYKARDYKPFKCAPGSLCKLCKQHYKRLYEEGLVDSPNPPNCSLSRKALAQKLSPKDFSNEEEYFDAVAIIDPVVWAYKELGWEPRWYQDWYLDCTAQFKVMRFGRRAGKTEVLVIDILHNLFTNSNYPILVITPYEPQLGHIFDIIRGFVYGSPLQESIRRSTANPHRLELQNGSYVLGFTAGSKSGARSDKIRGQDAKKIIIDECAYLNTAELNPVIAILASHPDCELAVSSTPTEAHDAFWQYWHDKKLGFKEFHVISQESPSWTDKTETFFKSTFTEGEYQREILAEPGYATNSVFKGEHIDASLVDYKLEDCTYDHERVYCIGVDWNKHAGAHIAVVEWADGKFRLVDKRIINPDEYKQLAAAEAVLQTWIDWPRSHIYPDAGYGSVQVEIMQRATLSEKYALLRDRIHPVELGGITEIRDPLTGLIEKKPTKPFMINLVAMQLEEGRIILPASEDALPKEGESSKNSWGLVRQMRNYRIERYTSKGQPIYSDDGDHTLTAWALAIMGLVLQYSDIVQRYSDPRILKVPSKADQHIDRVSAKKLAHTPLNRSIPQGYRGGLHGFQRLRRSWGGGDLRRRTF